LPFPDIDPIAFAIGPLVIRWYALAYLGGIGFGAYYGVVLLARKSLWWENTPPLSAAQFLDFAFWAVLGAIVGGRLGYVLFYNPTYFAANPMQVFQVWQGGMSFHGGLTGVVVAMILFARHKGSNVLSALDLLGAVAPIGLFLGRLANFVNGELYGRVTTLPWGVVFPGGGDLPRHPSQLYEALLEGLVLFLVIRLITHMGLGLRRPGLVAGVFGVGYGLSRILVEQVRLPDVQIGYLYADWITLGMVLTVPVLLSGIFLVWIALKRPASR
jgi:phosphatidylglycerol---prolipoprotein diacylglyceryl transferase